MELASHKEPTAKKQPTYTETRRETTGDHGRPREPRDPREPPEPTVKKQPKQ